MIWTSKVPVVLPASAPPTDLQQPCHKSALRLEGASAENKPERGTREGGAYGLGNARHSQKSGCGSKTTRGTRRPGWPPRRAAGSCGDGGWMHDKPVSFNARRYHMVEPHQGSMWALAAYVPQAYTRATEQHRQALREAGFPLPA